MQKNAFTDEDLMAYADGELDERRAAALDQALVDDVNLADRLAVFMNTRAISKEAWAPALQDPVPDHLIQHVRDLAAADVQTQDRSDETVVPFSPRRATDAKVAVWRMPLAAGLAFAIGLGAGLMLVANTDDGPGGLEIAKLTDPKIIKALDTVPSGDDVRLANGERLAPIATFFDGTQSLCREFEYDRTDGVTIVSVACQSAGEWDVRLAIAAGAADDKGYAPVASLDALNAYLGSNDAGPPLSLEAETKALEGLR